MIKKGDQVRFMNAVGGGIVTRIDEKNNLVYVEDEDGFEIPTLVRDCVVVPPVNEKTNFPRKDFNAKPEEKTAKIAEVSVPEPKIIPIIETPEGEILKVLLAFFPQDIKQLQTTGYDCYLVNDSNYYLYYNLINSNNGEWKSFANGLIEPNMQEELGSISKELLNDWENLRVQIIAFKKDKQYTPQETLDLKIKLNVVRFYKLHSFGENEYFDEPCMLIDLISEKENRKLNEITPEEIRKALSTKEIPVKRKLILKSDTKKPDVIEIDLHINELVDTVAGMTNADMLQLQLEKFHAVLDENKNHKGQKIVFIHGKGEGVLRGEIEKLLRTRYKSYFFQDASFREYGFGATMITIK